MSSRALLHCSSAPCVETLKPDKCVLNVLVLFTNLSEARNSELLQVSKQFQDTCRMKKCTLIT